MFHSKNKPLFLSKPRFSPTIWHLLRDSSLLERGVKLVSHYLLVILTVCNGSNIKNTEYCPSSPKNSIFRFRYQHAFCYLQIEFRKRLSNKMHLSYSRFAYLHPNVPLDRSIHLQLSGLNLLDIAACFLASPMLRRLRRLRRITMSSPLREYRGSVGEILPV